MAKIMTLLNAGPALRVLEEARGLLGDVTPLKTNCGRLCEGACCQSDETGENGMLLFPFEDRLYKKPIDGFSFRLLPDDTLFKGGMRLVCQGSCPREHRPLQCRLFPLRIRVESDSSGFDTRAVAEIDPRAWALCPLPEMGGLRAMSAAFIGAVEQAGNALLKNVYMLEALSNEQRLVDELRAFPAPADPKAP